MFIGFLGGIIFLAGILLIICSFISRKWINADIEATNWDESNELAAQLGPEAGQILHNNIDCCQECLQPSEDLVIADSFR